MILWRDAAPLGRANPLAVFGKLNKPGELGRGGRLETIADGRGARRGCGGNWQ